MPNCIGPEQAWVTNHNFRSGIPLPFPASPILLATPLRRLEVEMVTSPTTPNEPVTRTTFPDRCRGGARDKHPDRGGRAEESSRSPCLGETSCKEARLRSSSANARQPSAPSLRL